MADREIRVIDADAIAVAQQFVSKYGPRAPELTRDIAERHRISATESARFWGQVADVVASLVQVANSP